MKSAIKKAVVPAAVMAVFAAARFGTPEAITMMILASASFISAMVSSHQARQKASELWHHTQIGRTQRGSRRRNTVWAFA
jgi:hypothetical protein